MTTKTDDTNARLIRAMGTKVVRNLERPKPLTLKTANPIARHSAPDVPQRIVLNILEEVMSMVENLQFYVSAKNYAEIVQITPVLTNKLKVFGIQLEEFYKDQLDKAFMSFRDAAKDDKLDHVTRTHLLEIVELRAMQWQIKSHGFSGYFSSKQLKVEAPSVSEIITAAEPPTSPVAHLAPGEVIKPSGKYPAPTRLQGKNYCKDEVVIRNADSGKVNPGAKERLVQITGPTEDKIILARNLIEDTIKRNASPVREIPEKEFPVGSSSSLNSSTSDDLQAKLDGEMGIFGHIDPSEVNYKHTIAIGGCHIYMFSDDFDIISKAKLALDLHFSGRDPYGKTSAEAGTQCNERDFIRNQTPPQPALPVQQPQLNLQQSGGVPKVSKRSRKISEYVPYVCPPIINKSSGVRIEYSRDFLLDLSSSILAKAHPPAWSSIAAEFPSIVKQVVCLFDPVAYAKLWKSMDNSSSVLGEVWSDSD